MIRKASTAIAFASLMIVFSDCGSKTAAPATSNSSTASNTATGNSSTASTNNPGTTAVTVTGKCEQVGKDGEWKGTIDMVGMDGFLWSVEPDGSLWKTDKSGNDILVDKGGFKGCTDLAAMDAKLWTIENGTFYKTDPTSLRS